MAEGFSKTIHSGSHADIEFPCTPCEDDDVRKEAVSYCQSCNQYFCSACLKCHARFPATKAHLVADVQAKEKHETRVVRATVVAKCPTHPDRDIEMYCSQHDMVYCALCVAKEHRTCTGVIEVTDQTDLKLTHSDLQALIGKIGILQNKFQDSRKRKKENIKQLETKEKEMIEEITESGRMLVQHIKNLQGVAVTSLSSTREELVSQIMEEITQAEDLDKNLQKSRNLLVSFEGCSRSQEFIQQILGRNTVARAEDFLSKLDSYKSKDIVSNVNTSLRDYVLQTKYIAQLKEKIVQHVKKTEEPPKVKNIVDVNVKVQGDKHTCKITGITQLPDGTVVICDNLNKKLKRLDDQWKVKDYCALQSCPWGVCCTGDSEVAVKMSADTVQFVTIGSTLSKTREIEISGGNVLGIGCIFGQLWVSQVSSINVYSISGSLVKQLRPRRLTLTFCPQGIHGREETVYVSGSNDQIVCFDKEGCIMAVIKDQRLVWPRGVCLLRENIICVVGYISNNVVMFRKDESCIGELVEARQVITNPWALCYMTTSATGLSLYVMRATQFKCLILKINLGYVGRKKTSILQYGKTCFTI